MGHSNTGVLSEFMWVAQISLKQNGFNQYPVYAFE